ncbi:MAG: SCP2 sterol-binding domain-containing protein [Candidatus Helarchaeota archaeon]
MELPDEPSDILGLAMYRVINNGMISDPGYRKFVSKLNENIVLSTDYYDIMISFKDNSFTISRNIENPTVIIKVSVEEFFRIMEKQTSMIFSFLKGKMKFKKGLFKVLKIYKLFSKIMS